MVWSTPTATDGGSNTNSASVTERGHGNNLAGMASHWPTPLGSDGKHGSANQYHGNGDSTLSTESASLAKELWHTPHGFGGQQGGAAGECQKQAQAFVTLATGLVLNSFKEECHAGAVEKEERVGGPR